MDDAPPILMETPKTYSKIDYIEEITINKEKENYKIHFGIQGNDLLIKAESENTKNIYYYQYCFTINELQNISMIFSMYKAAKEIIAFLKDLKFEIEEKNENLLLKFNVFMPNGQNKLIELVLKKCLLDTNNIIKYLLEKIKSMETNIKNLEENIKLEKTKHNSEIKELKDNISNLKENNIRYENENKKLWDEINKLKESQIKFSNKDDAINSFDSKIIESKDNINFILDYIKKNDKTLNISKIKLLFRGSRDGERTKTCHELCDNKQHVLIIMKSETGYIFGGYSKIGFKANKILEYKIDNNCFLFSVNLKKIYPVIKDKNVICHTRETSGLCFFGSLMFYDYFMSKKDWPNLNMDIKQYFNNLETIYEMNGGQEYFKCDELEVFQLL